MSCNKIFIVKLTMPTKVRVEIGVLKSSRLAELFVERIVSNSCLFHVTSPATMHKMPLDVAYLKWNEHTRVFKKFCA